MLIKKTLRRTLTQLQKQFKQDIELTDEQKPIYDVKVPIKRVFQYPAPTQLDYEVLNVTSKIKNDELVEHFKKLAEDFHPMNEETIESIEKWKKIEEAYDKIVLYRMGQIGIPQTYVPSTRTYLGQTKQIKEYLLEHNLIYPELPQNYVIYVLGYWAFFGLFYTFFNYKFQHHFMINDP